MTDILIQEVNDAMRRERAEQAWEKNRGLIIALIVAIIFGTAGGQIYRSMKAERNAAFTNGLVDATESLAAKNYDDAAKTLESLAADAKGEHKAMAQLWLARAYIEGGKQEEAKAPLEDVLKNGTRATVWHDAACVWMTGLTNTFPEQCDASAKSPLQTTKMELAIADAIAKKDWVKARSLYAQLRELASSLPEQRQRVVQLGMLLPPEVADAKDAAQPAAKAKE